MPLMTKLHPRRDCDDGEEKHANIAGIFDEFFFAVHSVVKTKSWDIPTTSSFFFWMGWLQHPHLWVLYDSVFIHSLGEDPKTATSLVRS